MSKEEITIAKIEDVPQIVAFSLATYKDVKLKNSSPDFDKITESITRSVLKNQVLVRRNKENESKIDCVMVLEIGSSWWSKEPILRQKFFFVVPEFRDGNLFLDLLDAAEEYAIMLDMPLLQEVVGSSFQAKGRILERRNYRQIGVSYITNA